MKTRRDACLGLRRADIAIAIVVGLMVGGLPAIAQAIDNGRRIEADGQSARFDLPSDPDQVIVRFTERFGELASDDYPSLHVYADGRVVRHRPAYMAQHGDITGRVSDDGLQRLLQSLSKNGILEFDSQSVRRATMEVRQSRSIRTMMTDPSTIEIEVRLAGYRPDENAALERDYRKVVTWTGLRYDSRTYPEVTAVQNLAAAFRQLTELAEQIEQSGSRQGGGS